ncbi:MAG TPA: peptidylprolyl isomerase [Acidimicrobiales bacterium]|nr:peptidylprolyl isomerase [Acidimicrobiales bacterium]
MTTEPGPIDDPRRRHLTIAGAALAAVVILGLLVVLVGGGDDDAGTAVDTDTTGTTDTTPPPDGDPAGSDGTTTAQETTAPPAGAMPFAYGTGECAPDEKPPEPVVRFDDAPQRCIADDVGYVAVITTDLGEITIDLDQDGAPGTVNNFVNLARWAAYDGTTFHRVIPDFVAQGGDPVGDPPGTGDIGYTIPDELPEPGTYEIGSVAMANRYQAQTGQGADSGSAQFFIVTGEHGATLPPHYSLFGRVIDGMDVVEAIEERGSDSGTPTEVVTIRSVDIQAREG